MSDLHHRRAFLRSAAAAGVGWATADLSQVNEAIAWAAAQQGSGQPRAPFAVLTASQAAVIEAMSARIIPSVDGRPGAREAGAVMFIDRSLATFNAAGRTVYVRGIADLNRRAGRAWSGTVNFAALTPMRQDALLRTIQMTPFFQAVRFDTIVGTFGLPVWGGNRDHAGWRMLGLDHQTVFQPPFGDYDADEHRRS